MLAYDLAPAVTQHAVWTRWLARLLHHTATGYRRLQVRQFAAPWAATPRPRRLSHG